MRQETQMRDLARELVELAREGWRRGRSRLAEVAVATVIFALLLVVLLLMAKGLWSVYGETPTGQRFALQQALTAAALDRLLDAPVHGMALEITGLSLRVLFPLCLLAQLSQLLRRLYFDQGPALRLLFAGLPACLLAAAALAERHETPLGPCLPLVAFTTLALLPATARLCRDLVPEADDVLRFGKRCWAAARPER